MSGLSKTGIVLIVVISVTLAAFLAQLCYVLWCRRRFHRQNLSGELADDLSTNNPYCSTSPSSKELFYFFCWKNQSRIEPASAPQFLSDAGNDVSPDPSGDLMKWGGMYGPSRVLFTITEEEKEDLESSDHKPSSETNKTKKRVSLEEHFEAVQEQEPALATMMAAVYFEETPFSTPCDSPLYYTPSPSPTREVQLQRRDANLTHSPEPDLSVAVEVGELHRGSSENGFSGGSKCRPSSVEVV